ncbi:MAG: PEP-CTERM sorting domain-containing protein [Planctomycetota bacterium]
MKRILKEPLRLLAFASLIIALHDAATAQNDLLVSAPDRDTIERFDATTGEYLGSFVSAGSGGLNNPLAVTVGPDDNIYVSSALTGEILRYDGQSGDFLDVFASGNGLFRANNLRFFGDHLYVGQFASGANGLIKRFDATTGAFLDNFIASEWVDGFEFGSDSIFVSNYFGGVGKYDLETGAFEEQFISVGEGDLANPTALLLLDNNELLVGSDGTDSIKRYSSTGDYIGEAIPSLINPEGLVIGPNGNLFAGSYSEGFINEYNLDDFSFVSRFADTGGSTNFFTFRITAIPEPSLTAPLLLGLSAALIRRRR